MTVKELSKQTGISARTLHYYDEIGLFTPTEKSGAGYRLYDDQALERLQQILFFRAKVYSGHRKKLLICPYIMNGFS